MQIDRKRAALFEASALDYDTYRPDYPKDAICEVVSLSCLRSSSRLLEIGCGTGQATVQFAARGYMIDCVDPGRKLLAIARKNCRAWPNVSFTPGRFEEATLDPGRYDLLYSAQAFHWVDPRVRLEKAARLLRDGGSLALLYNYPGLKKNTLVESLSQAVRWESGGKMRAWDYADQVADWKKEIASCGHFRAVRLSVHPWVQEYSAERYTGLFRTYSDFLSLPARARRNVLVRMKEIIDANGGFVSRSYDCVVIHAQK